jgi:tetratricopeptide (TPR) repeat protein
LQTTLLITWSSRAITWLLLTILILAFLVALVIALKQKTPTEKFTMARELHMEALRLFKEREYEKAEALAAHSVDLNSEESVSWGLLGRIKLHLGKPVEAIYAYDCAINVNKQPTWKTFYLYYRAIARVLCREFGHARNDLNGSIVDDPRSAVSLRWRALVCYYMGDFSAALSDAEFCVRESPLRIGNQAVLAIVAKAAGKANQALKATEDALRIRPEKPQDYYYLAALKGVQGESTEAIRLLHIAIQMDDNMKSRAFFDPLWDCLREDDSFSRLFASHEGKHADYGHAVEQKV